MNGGGGGGGTNFSNAQSSVLSSAFDTNELLEEGILSPTLPNGGKDRDFTFALANYQTTLPPRPYPNDPNDFLSFLKDGPQAEIKKMRESESSQGSSST